MRSNQDRILYQFPISHYCEKTRWNLDAKGLSYRVRNLFPGFHRILVRRLTGGLNTVPVLDDQGVIVGDSAAIALHLERRYPDTPLLPTGEADRVRALELSAYFDKTAGRYARQWAYAELLAHRRGGAADAFFSTYTPGIRLLGKAFAPIFEALIHRQYRLGKENIERAREGARDALARLEQETSSDPGRYLVGDRLSIADISAASLLAPLVAPPGSPWTAEGGIALPSLPAVEELRAELRTRPGGAWVLARYAKDRLKTHQGEAAPGHAA